MMCVRSPAFASSSSSPFHRKWQEGLPWVLVASTDDSRGLLSFDADQKTTTSPVSS